MRKKRTQTTKAKIVSAAWKLFYEQGYEDTTVDDIVYESGTSKGSFYHYFSGKDALLSSLSYLFDEKYAELTDLTELNALLPENACVVLAHPFRVKMTVMDPTPLFGIEAHNGLTELFRNQMAEDYARQFGKALTSGSDCHHPIHACKGGIETPRIIRTPRDLTDVLRSGEYRLYRG